VLQKGVDVAEGVHEFGEKVDEYGRKIRDTTKEFVQHPKETLQKGWESFKGWLGEGREEADQGGVSLEGLQQRLKEWEDYAARSQAMGGGEAQT
ncbi:hypothetical protein NPN14_23780, partial [Vibrio parahaemolyticus]|uniref:hypothetical protein n=1 Tax=Vibrio parahaemolyticus TaxID=670 RepID=UPI00211213BF